MSRKTQEIRVGIIRCDLHAFWYAPIFERPNPKVFRKMTRCCHYYFYKWEDAWTPRLGGVPGMSIAKVFDEGDQAKAEALSETYGGRPKVCDSYEEVSDGVDLVYIADCDYEGKDHLRFARPGLEKGVPHFVDKPFAYTLEDAREMIALAKKHKTAVMCSSLLRQSPFLKRFRTRLADIAPVGCVYVPLSYGPSLACIFHGVSIVQNVMREGCEWVESMGPTLYDVLRMHYPGSDGGTEVIMLNAFGRTPGDRWNAGTYHHCGCFASAYGAGGAIHAPRVDDYLFLYGGLRIVRMAKRMAETGKPPIAYDSMLELMEMIEAARLAHNKGKRVYLKEVR